MAQRKVVIIGPAHPLRGGLATFNERLARQFMAEGFDTTIFTFSLQYPKFIFPGTTQYSSEPAPADLTIEVAMNSINPFNWWKVGRRLKKMRPDIIVVRYWLPLMGPCLGTILRKVKKNRFTKIICIADNIIPHEKRAGDKPFTRYFIKPIDAFVTMSEKVMADLRLFTTTKPARQVLHPLYDNFGAAIPMTEAREKAGLPAQGRLLLFFGFIRKYKGLDMLLQAMHMLQQQPGGAPCKLVVAGEFYEDEAPYLQQVKDLRLEETVILKTQFIPDSEVRHYLCSADCVVQPYRNATQSGVTPLAYHFEKPMIVTNVGGLPALVPDGVAGLIAAPNPEDIARKINDFFAGEPQRFLPGLQTEKKNYAWDKLTGTIVSLAAGNS
jgi:glycosyltransferase involved in cell wall biosynthesis